METVPFAKTHAQQAAEIHIEGQPGTFLTRLGPEVLTRLYECMAESPLVIGEVVMDGDVVAAIAIASQNTNQMFSNIKRRYWHRLLWPMVKQMACHPSILGAIWQNMRYPSAVAAPEGEAEILFLGLRRPYMRHGIAPRLGPHVLNAWYERGCKTATAVVDRRNRPMRWTIAGFRGVYVDHEFLLNGRTMIVYRADLPLDIPPERDEDSADQDQVR